MIKKNFKKYLINLYAKVFFAIIALPLSANNPISIVEKYLSQYDEQQYSIQITSEYDDKNKCPTLAYLHEESGTFKNEILNKSYGGISINKHIEVITPQIIETIINKAINQEIKMHNDNHVFYHGSKREFLLFQDLFDFLAHFYKIKKTNDFYMLRVPQQNLNYKNIKELFKKYNNRYVGDCRLGNDFLLSVVPSLFSYTYSIEEGCSSFYYFIRSFNIGDCLHLSWCENIFVYFGIENLFNKYKKTLEKLLFYLNKDESDKTGLLLQIFIPKTFPIDDIVYPCSEGGFPIKNIDNDKSGFKSPDASEYLKELFDCFSSCLPLEYKDKMQLRILLKNDVFLDLENPYKIKIFRYFNDKTKNMQLYEEEFALFSKKLENDLIKILYEDCLKKKY